MLERLTKFFKGVYTLMEAILKALMAMLLVLVAMIAGLGMYIVVVDTLANLPIVTQ